MPGKHILPIIIISQFFCTSMWFAGNAVMANLLVDFGLPANALGHLSSAVQLGFITGTLCYALFTISDRYSPSKVFFVSSLLAAVSNLLTILPFNQFGSLLFSRFATGFFLAGIYPVGMKIAADYYDKKLGKSLGYLVGALVLGTAFPHLLKAGAGDLSWKFIIVFTSSLAVTGGVLVHLFIPDGPYRKPGSKPDLSAFFTVFKSRPFRDAAFGYFGHMWELYALWTFLPFLLSQYMVVQHVAVNASLLSFYIIGMGCIGCIAGGYTALITGSKKTAFTALLISGLCCCSLPVTFHYFETIPFFLFLLIWGATISADSPQFSTLVAQNAIPEYKGTALTIVNCIGFAISIVSIQLLNLLKDHMPPHLLSLPLAIGPFLGLIALGRSRLSR